MNAKDYLEGIRTIEGDLERTLGCIQRCEDLLGIHGIRYDGEDFSSTGSHDKLSEAAVELMEYREYLKAIEKHYIELEKEAVYVISGIGEPNKRRALGLRFMDNMTFREIGRRMKYSPEGARHLCDGALRDLEPHLIKLIQDYRELTLSDKES